MPGTQSPYGEGAQFGSTNTTGIGAPIPLTGAQTGGNNPLPNTDPTKPVRAPAVKADVATWNAVTAGPAAQWAAQSAGEAQGWNAVTAGPAQTWTASQAKPAQTYTAGQGTAQQAGLINWNVDGNQLVQNQLTGLIAQDNPYMQAAKTTAMQGMNARGLANSSMAVGAAHDAAIRSALPIAAQDAGTYAQAGQFNAGQANETARFNTGQANSMTQFNVGEQNVASRFGAEQMNLTDRFNVGETNQAGMFSAGQQNEMKRFDAGEQNRAGMFTAGEKNQMAQFNTGQANAVGMFNTGQSNDMSKFNVGQQNSVGMANTQAQNQANNDYAREQNKVLADEFNLNADEYMAGVSLSNNQQLNLNTTVNSLIRDYNSRKAAIINNKDLGDQAKSDALKELEAESRSQIALTYGVATVKMPDNVMSALFGGTASGGGGSPAADSVPNMPGYNGVTMTSANTGFDVTTPGGRNVAGGWQTFWRDNASRPGQTISPETINDPAKAAAVFPYGGSWEIGTDGSAIFTSPTTKLRYKVNSNSDMATIARDVPELAMSWAKDGAYDSQLPQGFDPAQYWAANTDLQDAFSGYSATPNEAGRSARMGALIYHYLNFGKRENRPLTPGS